MTTLSKQDELCLSRYKARFGEMSSSEALECALNAEQIAKDCGPFDPVSGGFFRSCQEMTNYAILLEKVGK